VKQRVLEGTDQVRAALNKESSQQAAKISVLEMTLRDVRTALADEAAQRETALRMLNDALVEERAVREATVVKAREFTKEV